MAGVTAVRSRTGAGRGATRTTSAASPARRDWYRLSVRAEQSEADLYVFDSIGRSWWDDETVTAKQFIADLNALPASVTRINLHVNSPGGDVFDAVTIANALKAHPARVAVSIEGLAASAATIITSAGDEIRIAENALMMVHNPWSIVLGDADDMRAAAEQLDRVRAAIIATYQWHSKLSAAELGELMDEVTWMDAAESVANGFATEVGAEVKAAASLDRRAAAALGAIPAEYANRIEVRGGTSMPNDAPNPAPTAPAAPAPAAPQAGPTPAPAAPALSNVVSITADRESQIQREERSRVKAIRTSFTAMAERNPHLAAEIGALETTSVDNGVTEAVANKALLDLLASREAPPTNSAVTTFAPGGKGGKAIDVKAIYDRENGRTKKQSA